MGELTTAGELRCHVTGLREPAIRKQLTRVKMITNCCRKFHNSHFFILSNHRLLDSHMWIMKYLSQFLFLFFFSLAKIYSVCDLATHGTKGMWLSNRMWTTESAPMQFITIFQYLVCAKYEIIMEKENKYIATNSWMCLHYFYFIFSPSLLVKSTTVRPQQWFQFYYFFLTAMYLQFRGFFAGRHHCATDIANK